MIQDENGNVLALDKVDEDYNGTTFPGGHVEKNETFADSIIREVKEETGLLIRNPALSGVYHWVEDDIHSVIFLYKATEFSGTLQSSEEGKVYWTPLDTLGEKNLAVGMEAVLKIMESSTINECYVCLEGDGYVPKFNNNGRMVFNCIDYPRDNKTEKVHPTQKSVPLLKFLIELFTDVGDVVIDPCAGSGTSLLAAASLGRKAYGFEIKKDFYKLSKEKILSKIELDMFTASSIEEKKYIQKELF